MSREIIFYENHFIEFYQSQDEKVKEKMKYVLELIKQVEKVPEKFFKTSDRNKRTLCNKN